MSQKQQEKDYLENTGACPYCGKNLFAVDINASDYINLDTPNTVFVKMICDNCLRRWTDIYTLVGVILSEED